MGVLPRSESSLGLSGRTPDREHDRALLSTTSCSCSQLFTMNWLDRDGVSGWIPLRFDSDERHSEWPIWNCRAIAMECLVARPHPECSRGSVWSGSLGYTFRGSGDVSRESESTRRPVDHLATPDCGLPLCEASSGIGDWRSTPDGHGSGRGRGGDRRRVMWSWTKTRDADIRLVAPPTGLDLKRNSWLR